MPSVYVILTGACNLTPMGQDIVKRLEDLGLTVTLLHQGGIDGRLAKTGLPFSVYDKIGPFLAPPNPTSVLKIDDAESSTWNDSVEKVRASWSGTVSQFKGNGDTDEPLIYIPKTTVDNTSMINIVRGLVRGDKS